MADLVKGITHTAEGLAESTIALIHTALHVAYTFVHGLAMLLYNTVESFAAFLGASVNFVLSNLALLVVLVVGYIVYSRNTAAGRRSSRGAKKVA